MAQFKGGVSRLERRNEILMSTLRKSVEAMGGERRLVKESPDRGRVALSGFGRAQSADGRCPRVIVLDSERQERHPTGHPDVVRGSGTETLAMRQFALWSAP